MSEKVKNHSDKRNGAVAKLRELFNALHEDAGDLARKDALTAAVEKGFNKATASTQFQKWKKALSA